MRRSADIARMVSKFRLNVMRAMYFMIFLFLSTQTWPGVIDHATRWSHMQGVGFVLLAALAPLALLGVLHPLKMVPLLMFELVWKSIWLVAIGLPLRSANALNADMAETFKACAIGVVLLIAVIPWPYVWATFLRPSRILVEWEASGGGS